MTKETQEDTRALAGIRVLDLTSVVVGPAATLRLADLGAEVIKIETPGGDLLRTLGGPSPSGRMSGKYLHFNRAKRSVCLDLKKPGAGEALLAILATCDVLVSNIRPEALARLGLDAETCRARQPGLIHCSITGFGPGGAYRGRPAYDSVIQGVSGVAGLALQRDGVPRYAPLLLADHVVGEITAGQISAALFRRSRTGQGTTLEIPMFETMAAFVLQEHLGPQSFHPPLGPAGDTRVLDPDNRPLETADGWMCVTSNTDAQAHGFLRAIGRADLIEDPRFRTVGTRFRHARDWFALRTEAMKTQTTTHWLEVLGAADVPVMLCHTLQTLPGDEHLQAVELLTPEHHPQEGPITTIHPSLLLDGKRAPPGHPAEHTGWSTRAVLEQAGLPLDAIATLLATSAAVDGQAA
ncbi:CaiB/BaiF CoA-transferase family protein [Acidisphaera sp. L21]|uniref:CaiB/BaiF CoA transferase family protein n=1 Tax=Acidisphaera sp. L21 TaxID=1641851 RepID=UPI00131D5B27|nr:CoA transferase [Acidisphaera sp. L21]